MSNRENEQDQRQILTLIRFALLGGVVIFGGIAWLFARGLEPGGFAPELVQGVEQYVWYGFILLFLGVFGGALTLQSRWASADDFEAKKGLNIAGWALAEFPALLGALYLLLVGDPTFFVIGLALMGFVAFVLLPVPSSE